MKKGVEVDLPIALIGGKNKNVNEPKRYVSKIIFFFFLIFFISSSIDLFSLIVGGKKDG